MVKIIRETARLYFRELLETDDHHMLELDSDPEVHRYLGNRPITTIGQARGLIQHIRQQYHDNGIGRLAIIEKETDQFVGWGGFKLVTTVVNGHQNYHDLGYRFMKRYWGKGYATESSIAALQFAFDDLNLPMIYAMADAEHKQSQKILLKCGFAQKNMFDYESAPHYWYELANYHLL